MRRLWVVAFVLVFGLVDVTSAKAGAPLPCISATLSANGNALVVNDRTLGGRDGDTVRWTEASTFRVFRSYRDPNAGVNGPNKYWAQPFWALAFGSEKSEFHGKPPIFGKQRIASCPYALVTDDAEYLVLLGNYPFNRVALSIYRRDQSSRPTGFSGPPGGVLVREVALSELSPEVQVRESDDPPVWYSSGTFSFSADERTLIFTTNDGKRLQISLLTGDVKR